MGPCTHSEVATQPFLNSFTLPNWKGWMQRVFQWEVAKGLESVRAEQVMQGLPVQGIFPWLPDWGLIVHPWSRTLLQLLQKWEWEFWNEEWKHPKTFSVSINKNCMTQCLTCYMLSVHDNCYHKGKQIPNSRGLPANTIISLGIVITLYNKYYHMSLNFLYEWK